MDEIDLLSKRFKDFIDKIQTAFDKASEEKPEPQVTQGEKGKESPVKLYTVISPVEEMAKNLHSVLNAIDKAIDNIDELTQKGETGENNSNPETSPPLVKKGVCIQDPGQKKFTSEELDYLVQTFNKILNTPEEERKRLFRNFEKSDPPPENGA